MTLFRFFVLILLFAAVACEEPAGGGLSSGNKLWVSISGAAEFSPHNLWFEVFDSASLDGTLVGWGVISMNEDGTGSGILRNPGDGADRLLEDGTWWLYILADLDNSIADWSVILPRTSGDRYTGMLSVTMAGMDVTRPVTPADFTHTEP